MLPFKTSAALLILALGLVSANPALARGNDITFKTGKGEEFTIKNGFFGSKKKVVKDRFGNKYESKKGWFGTRETDASVLGNSFQRKKGLLGGTDISGSTILGDSIRTKKGIFGRRTTEVDMSGITNLVQGFIESKTSGGSGLSGLGLGKGKLGAKSNGTGVAPDANFDLSSFDLNSGLPKDFGQGPAPGSVPGSVPGSQDAGYGFSPATNLPDGSSLPPNSALPEVPPRVQ